MEFTIDEEFVKRSPLSKEELERRLKMARSLVGIIEPRPGEPYEEAKDLARYRKSVEEAEAYAAHRQHGDNG